MRVAILLLVVFAAFVSADIWSNRGTSSDHLKISTVTITPDPPVAGQNLTVSASGVLDESVTNGTVNLVLKYDSFITILKKTYLLCDNPDYTCPISAGDYSNTITEMIPASAPNVCLLLIVSIQ
eukprot:Phypoly_transcript_19735.p1 GENE.Phypoly_transcript_19735~~Phypoly_transcript_19735.p1  ORF type:complete len:124 (+),score=14.10 Phypoly_transcript_19735:108-479(+)